MVCLIVVIALALVSQFVFGPLFLMLGGRICRIPGVTFLRGLGTFGLLAAVGLVVGVVQALVLDFSAFAVLALGIVDLVATAVLIPWCLRTSFWRAVGAYAISVVLLVALALGIRATVMEAFGIPNYGMAPTLVGGDHVFVDKLSRHFGPPKRGDIIVHEAQPSTSVGPPHLAAPSAMAPATAPASGPTVTYVRRVAGVAGDTVEVRGNRLYVNGAAAEEPWACLDARQLGYRDGGGEGRNFGPALVPAGSVFLLGDNRDNSLDSRYEGCVAVDKVKGRVMLIYWSRDPEDFNGQWRRWDAEKGTVIQGGGRFSLDGGSSVPPRRVHWGRLGPVR